MSTSRVFSRRFFINLIHIACLLALLTACSGSATPAVNVAPQTTSRQENTPKAEINFEVSTPSRLADGQNLYLEILDEVTGLALNASRVRLQSQDQRMFSARLPLVLGSVLKYRYVRDNDPVGIEYTTQGEQVRYRMYSVDGPGSVRDYISAWRSEPNSATLGRIQGQVANNSNNAPVVSAMILAGGVRTLTGSDGSFILEGMVPGTHNLLVYSLDGSFKPFQQGATVAPESTTPALVMVTPAKMVRVSFTVKPPADHVQGIPLRLLGNTYGLGNTFADLNGGVSMVASRAPLMAAQADGRYTLTLELPAGLDLRYKYSLGDGFWNAERSAAGEVRTRQLIVPNQNAVIEDSIDTWMTPGFAPVSFTVTTPPGTPNTDTIAIQLNPYGWTQPLPMWPTGANQWSYVLYNPLNLFTSASYRFCRNEQCNIADAAETMGPSAQGKTFSPQASALNFQDAIQGWAWSEAPSDPVVVPAVTINSRGQDFMAGVQLLAGYSPTWQPYLSRAFQNIKDVGANTVILKPTWHVTHQSPPVMAALPGKDPLWFDLSQMAIQAQQKGLHLVFRPMLVYPEAPETWWAGASRDANWWQSWFDRYQSFMIYHADMAAQTGARALVIGDGSLLPALPGGTLADGSPSGVPGNADGRWVRLIEDLRTRYTGKLVWLLPYSGQMPQVPAFLNEVDEVYVEIQPPLTTQDGMNASDLENHLSAMLDADLLKLQSELSVPLVIGLQYPSAQGALDGCIGSGGECLPLEMFENPVPQAAGVALAQTEQAEAYSALLSAINQRSWVSGFYAGGYYPPVELKDLSVSIRSKRAADVLWYWYPRLLGQVSP